VKGESTGNEKELRSGHLHFNMLDILKNAFNRGAVHPEESQSGSFSKKENDAIRYAVFLSVPHDDVEALHWANHIDVHLRAAGLTVFWNEFESALVDWQSALFNCVTFMPILSSNTFVNPVASDDFNQCLLECELASVLYERNMIRYYTPVFVGVRQVISYLQLPNEDGILCDTPHYDETVQEFTKWPEHPECGRLDLISDTVRSLLSDWAIALKEDEGNNNLDEIIDALYARDVSAIFGDAEACERALQIVVEMTRNAQICSDEGFDVIVMVEADFFHRAELSDSSQEYKPTQQMVENFMRQLHDSNFLAQMMVIDTRTEDDTNSNFVNISQADVLTIDQMIDQFLQPEFAKTKAIVRILCASVEWDNAFQYFDKTVLSNLQIRPVVFAASTDDQEYEDFSTQTILDIRRENYQTTSMVLKQALIEAEKRISIVSSQNPRQQAVRKFKIGLISALFFVLVVIIAVIATLPQSFPEIIIPEEKFIAGPCTIVKTNCHRNALCLDKIKSPQLSNFTNKSYSYSCLCENLKGYFDNDNMGLNCIYPLQNVSNVALESTATCAVLVTGQLYCWGVTFSQEKTNVAALFPGIANVKSIQLGPSSACALKYDGSVWCWGTYSNRNLGNGVSISTATPTKVPSLPAATSLCVTLDTACVITVNGVFCWGASFLAPTELVSLLVPTAVACGFEHVCILRNDRTVMCSGYCNFCYFRDYVQNLTTWIRYGLQGQLGTGRNEASNSFLLVNGLVDAVGIASGYSHTCIIAGSTGGALCWGQNGFGQLGIGTTSNKNTPTAVIGLESIRLTSVTTGRGHSCATTSTADVYCWGYNAYGQLGIGSIATRLSAVLVPNIKATSVTAGEFHTCAITLQKHVKCWGGTDGLPQESTAYVGQLGTGKKIGSE
jgi:alpha-tubulin suppressor-like RCC1 family protein